jgi:hypothetical protein
VGKGVWGDPFSYEASPLAREMAASILRLLDSREAYDPDDAEIAERLNLDRADVHLVLQGLVACGLVRQRGHGDKATYDRFVRGTLIDDDDDDGPLGPDDDDL